MLSFSQDMLWMKSGTELCLFLRIFLPTLSVCRTRATKGKTIPTQ